MRTNIEIDDELMEKAMKATGQRTKKAAVEAALRQVVRSSRSATRLWKNFTVSDGRATLTPCAKGRLHRRGTLVIVVDSSVWIDRFRGMTDRGRQNACQH